MTPGEFKLRYQQAEPPELKAFREEEALEFEDSEDYDEFVRLPARRGKNLGLTAEERELLTKVGLPENGPLMSYDELNYPQPLDGFPGCYQIGCTHDGAPVCLDTQTREVVYFNHDLHMQRVLVNSSLMKLAECIVVCMEHMKSDQDEAERDKKLLKALIEADPALASQQNIWVNG